MIKNKTHAKRFLSFLLFSISAVILGRNNAFAEQGDGIVTDGNDIFSKPFSVNTNGISVKRVNEFPIEPNTLVIIFVNPVAYNSLKFKRIVR